MLATKKMRGTFDSRLIAGLTSVVRGLEYAFIIQDKQTSTKDDCLTTVGL
jgi:hypothetical protein